MNVENLARLFIIGFFLTGQSLNENNDLMSSNDFCCLTVLGELGLGWIPLI